MNKSITGLVGGILMILLGLWLSVQSGQVLFIGLLVFGLLSIVISLVNLAKSRKTESNGMMIKAMHPEDRPQEMVSFLQTFDSQRDLEAPKAVQVTCSRKDQICQVSLNGEVVGIVQPDNPVIMNVTKENNVLSISNHYEGTCFFHVSDLADIGRIKVGMGVHTSALKVIPGGGIGEGIAIGKALPKEKKKMNFLLAAGFLLLLTGFVAVVLLVDMMEVLVYGDRNVAVLEGLTAVCAVGGALGMVLRRKLVWYVPLVLAVVLCWVMAQQMWAPYLGEHWGEPMILSLAIMIPSLCFFPQIHRR